MMTSEIINPSIDLEDFIANEPNSPLKITRSRIDLFQYYLEVLSKEINSSNQLIASRALYYTAKFYAKCPNTCKQNDIEDKVRIERAIKFYIEAMSQSNLDPQVVSIPVYLRNKSEIVGPGYKIINQSTDTLVPFTKEAKAELELSQIFKICIIELDEIYRTLLNNKENNSYDINTNPPVIFSQLQTLLKNAKMKYLTDDPNSKGLIEMLHKDSKTIFDLTHVSIDRKRLLAINIDGPNIINLNETATPMVLRHRIPTRSMSKDTKSPTKDCKNETTIKNRYSCCDYFSLKPLSKAFSC